jgi:hypothetical protein
MKKKDSKGEKIEINLFAILDLQINFVGIAILKDILFIGVPISWIEFII